ncbi:ribosome small subunit-dependent GTPase A [Paenibacillus sp. MMS18-CY102]|uniref:ribosome small subunit-dependent GTPase A n=1 Tax=Paenibacillus sp. MMS18-CY102 TaxID=2682849 RepID=UPI001365CAF7|nr:ribosome small subunit-dependent GTPase A [Paenibacillus sp. MMS18-CY102]MWC26712.1 ribosome small subunit-dependent GTPase A [Paenibacillus sp. MMS18-CY102]
MANNSELKGTIVKALAGFYYVQPDTGQGKPVQCRARGIFKKRGVSPFVGDRVVYSLTDNGDGAVEQILPRTSELIRPPVVNIELAVLVFSVTEPELNFQLLDKFLVHIEHAGLDTVICLSKSDLALTEGKEGESAREALRRVRAVYEPLGYEVFETSSRLSEGCEPLQQRLNHRMSVFAGQSGVGKSSLLNALVPGLALETNAISNRLGRGKHTTRHVELIETGFGGFVADTPGFSQLDFEELGIEDLGYCFREMRELSPSCKFRGCTHDHEPGCAVLDALEAGEIDAGRHAHYLAFMEEMKEKKRRY